MKQRSPSKSSPPAVHHAGLIEDMLLGEGIGAPMKPVASAVASSDLSTADLCAIARHSGEILVIDEDLALGARQAHEFLIRGYGCRVARASDAARTLGLADVDVVVVQTARARSLVDASTGPSRKETHRLLGPWKGPVVSIGSPVQAHLSASQDIVIEAVPEGADARTLIHSIEIARERHRTVAPADPDKEGERPIDPDDLDEQGRADIRFALDVNEVRALVLGGTKALNTSGRVLDISPGGGLLVESSVLFPPGSPVLVEMRRIDGSTAQWRGEVERTAPGQMVLSLTTDTAARSFLKGFIREALDPLHARIHPVRILRDTPARGEDRSGDIELTERFLQVVWNPERDDLHQIFIQDCIRSERLDFALRSYRALKNQRPGNANVDRYLQQIGTILSFQTFRRQAPEARPETTRRSRKTLRWVIPSIVIACTLAWLFLRVRR